MSADPNLLDSPTELRLFQWRELLPLRGPEPEAAPYPIAALGKFADAAQVITDQVQAPAPVVAQSILATASLVAQPHIDVEIDGREFPVSLFLITVATSGERKTATDKIVLSPIKAYERTLMYSYNENLKDWAADLAKLKVKKKDEYQDVKAIMDHEEKKPKYPMMLTKEPSYEGLVRSLHEGLPSMGLFSDEAGRFIGGYAMSNENMLKTAAGLSEMWDGSEITRTRGADNQIFTLHDRRLAMHLMLQPIVAYEILNNQLLLGQGFLPRCLVVQPQSRIGTRMYVESNTKDHPAVREMERCFKSLVKIELPNKDPDRETGEKSQRNVRLDEDAKRYWIQLHDEFEGKATKEYEPIQAMTCKAAEQVLRIAASLAFADDPDLRSIPFAAVERAASLMGFYLNEALRIQQVAKEDHRIKLAEKCIEWAFNAKDRTVAQHHDDEGDVVHVHMQGLLQKGPNPLRTKAKAERILKFLHEHGLAKKLLETDFAGTKRKEAWAIRRHVYDQESA